MGSSRANIPIDRYEILDSTSDEARRRVVTGGVALPFVIRADRQTKGRGRGTNTWWSDDGSLLFTLAFDPEPLGIERRHESRLALIAALAVIDASSLFVDTRVGIRWPNDVEAVGKKLAGILPERVETREGVRLLIGVGINVTTRFESAPAEVRVMATSLSDLGVTVERETLLVAFLLSFERHRAALVRDDPALSRRWNGLDRLAGGEVRLRVGERIIRGVGSGIDPDGGLMLHTESGLETHYGGQVLRS